LMVAVPGIAVPGIAVAHAMISATDVPLWVSGFEGVAVSQSVPVGTVIIEGRFVAEEGTDWRCYQRSTYGASVDIANPVIRTNRVDPPNAANYAD